MPSTFGGRLSKETQCGCCKRSSAVCIEADKNACMCCVFETQWRVDPEVGKDAVMAYFTGKGKTLRAHNVCPTCDLIEFIGDCNPLQNTEMLFNGKPHHGTFVLMYEPNKLALRMRQRLNGQVNHIIVDLTLNGQDQIRRIDLCMPELYRYRVLLMGKEL